MEKVRVGFYRRIDFETTCGFGVRLQYTVIKPHFSPSSKLLVETKVGKTHTHNPVSLT